MNNKIIYKQTDERWRSLPYPTTSSLFGGNGCGACSVLHCIIEQDKYRDFTPLDIQPYMKQYAEAGHGTLWSGISKALAYYGMENIKWFTEDAKMSEVFAELNKKNRIGILLFYKIGKGSAIGPDGTCWTTSGHFVSFVDYKYENNKHCFYIKDSGDRDHDGWYAYETSMKGVLPQVWTCTLPKEEPKTYSGTFPNISVKTITRKMTHASTSGVEKVKGGKAGDQTGKEVCTLAFKYSSKIGNHFHWTYVARPKSATVAKKIAQAMVDCANNDNIGYDQSQRLTLYTQAKKVKWIIKNIKTKCETDCSATVRVALKVAGIDVPSTFRTKNMSTNLKNTGKFTIYKYSTVKNDLKVGDILYYPHYHTAVITSVTTTSKNKSLVKGDTRKDEVKRLQEFLKWLGYNVGSIDGVFGDKTFKAVKQFQKDYGLTVDGEFGTKSLAKAKEIKCYEL